MYKFMEKLMTVLAAYWLVIASGDIFYSKVLLWTGLALFFTAAIGGMIYANTGSRFKK